MQCLVCCRRGVQIFPFHQGNMPFPSWLIPLTVFENAFWVQLLTIYTKVFVWAALLRVLWKLLDLQEEELRRDRMAFDTFLWKKNSVHSTYFPHAKSFDIFMHNNKKEIKYKLVQKNQHLCLLSSGPEVALSHLFPFFFHYRGSTCRHVSKFAIDIHDTHIWQSLTAAKMYHSWFNYFSRTLFEEFRYKHMFLETRSILCTTFYWGKYMLNFGNSFIYLSWLAKTHLINFSMEEIKADSVFCKQTD